MYVSCTFISKTFCFEEALDFLFSIDELTLSNRTFYPKWHITWQALLYKTFSVLSWLFNIIYMISFVVQLNPCLYKNIYIVLFHNFVTRNSRRLSFSNVLWSMEIYSLNSCINYCFKTYCPVVSINTLSNTWNVVKFCVPSLLINMCRMY